MNIFISHDFGSDSDRYQNLKAVLEKEEGISVIDARARAGEYLSEDLLRSIKQADLCIFICSNASIVSNWCIAEVSAFWALDKKIIIQSKGIEIEEISEKFPQTAGVVIADSDEEVISRITSLKSSEEFPGKSPNPPSLTVPVKSFIADQVDRENTPSTWQSRDLYVGLQGARNWLAVASDPEYKPFVAARSNLFDDNDPIGSLIDKAKCNSFISFGPGDSQLDKKIVLRYCNQNESSFTYHPIDINPYLLSKACHEIKSNTNANIPFGILADFEDNLEDIFQLINSSASGPKLFSILGYTLGNLDVNELTWIHTVAQKMSKGDFLLLDYLRVDEDFNFDDYEKNAHKEYTESLRHWIAHPTSVATGLGRNELVNNFEKAFDFKMSGSEDTDPTVGTQVVYTGFGSEPSNGKKPEEKLVVKMHRYRTPQFSNKICQQTRLQVVDHVESTNKEGFYKSALSLFVKT